LPVASGLWRRHTSEVEERMPYTLDDLEKAKAEVERISNWIANSNSNNPDAGQADLRAAMRELRHITASLKATGILPLTEAEKFNAELDKLFPNAKSKEIVEYQGKKYQRRFYPADKSRSGKTVFEWDKWWEEVNS
jgi:hypothetical protein